MCGGWHKAGVSGFVISISTSFFGSPKPCNGNVQTSAHEEELESFSLKRWDTYRGRHVVGDADGFGVRTLESLVRTLQEQEETCGALHKLDRR